MLTCTPAEFRTIRHALGYSTRGMAHALGVKSGRTVRKWEAGDRDIPGLTQAIMVLFRKRRLVPKDLGV